MDAQDAYAHLCQRLAMTENMEKRNAIEKATDEASREIVKEIDKLHSKFHPNLAILANHTYDNDFWCTKIQCINNWLDKNGWTNLQ